MYDNAADAGQYLNETIVQYDGKPYWCRRVRDDMTLDLRSLDRKRTLVNASLKDPKLSVTKFPRLGYVNPPPIEYIREGETINISGAVFLERVPSRTVKQGLCNNNTNLIGEENRPDAPRINNNIIGICYSPTFLEMWNNTYPSFKEACELLEKGEGGRALTSIAFCRDFAVSQDQDLKGLKFLLYRGRRVAWSNREEFELPQEYEYLKELMDFNGVLLTK